MYALIFMLLFQVRCAYASPEQPYDAIINLGGDCQPAYQMYMHGVRYYALPFDKLITPFPALQKLLENKFDRFLVAEHLALHGVDKDKHIRDTQYDVRLLHDFQLNEDFLKEYADIKNTYDRRVARFFDLIATSKKPLFIRKNITREEAAMLVASLKTLCNHANFTLLVLDGAEEFKKDWSMPNVKNRHLRQPTPYVWKGDSEVWKDVLVSVGLTLGTRENSTSEV